MATVFVGIPTRNRPHFVSQALESVVAQSFTDIRIMVSDNHSDHVTIEALRTHVEQLQDPRVTLFIQPVNCGHTGQLLFLFEQCREDFFMLLDDDDLLEPGFLETAVGVLEQDSDLAFFGCDQLHIDESGAPLPEMTQSYNRQIGRNLLPEGVVEALLTTVLLRGVFSFSATLFRASAMRECGLLDAPNVQNIDYNVFLRLAERGKRAYWCTQKLSRYRWHGAQTRTRANWEFNELWISTYAGLLARRGFSGEAEKIRRHLLSFAYRRIGYIELVRGRYRDAYRHLAMAVRLDPGNWRMWGKVGFALCLPFLVPPLWKRKVTLAPPIEAPAS